jgi:hypothetical protein
MLGRGCHTGGSDASGPTGLSLRNLLNC